MTEPQKKAAAPRPAALSRADLDALHGHLDIVQAFVQGHADELRSVHAKVDLLLSELNGLKARADEAEKLLNSPAAKVVRGAQSVWKGLK